MRIKKRSIKIASARTSSNKAPRSTNRNFFLKAWEGIKGFFGNLFKSRRSSKDSLRYQRYAAKNAARPANSTPVPQGRRVKKKAGFLAWLKNVFSSIGSFFRNNFKIAAIAVLGAAIIVAGIIFVPKIVNAVQQNAQNDEPKPSERIWTQDCKLSEEAFYSNISNPGEVEKLEKLKTFTVKKGENTMTVAMRSDDATVIDALKFAGVTYDSNDEVAPKGKTLLEDGMDIVVVDIEIKTYKKQVSIDYKTVERKDSTLAKGKKVVTQKGVKGVKEVEYRDVYRDGVKSSSKVLSEKTTKKAVNKIVSVGTSSSNSNFTDADAIMLAKLIYAEARGESTEGKIAVGTVVMNRVNSSRYPNTISGVITQPYQFASLGSYNTTCLNIAKKVIAGERNLPSDVLYFWVTSKGKNWGSKVFYKQIGNHHFFK